MENAVLSRSDAEIVRQVIGGEVHAFEHLLRRHEKRVLGIVKRHVPPGEVEETAQEVFVRAYRALPGFKERGAFSQWLSAITVRTCHDFWRKRYRSREVPMSTLSEGHRKWVKQVLSEHSAHESSEKEARAGAKELLEQALSQLSAGDRMVLELVYLEGYSGREAASLLGWSVANVKVRSFRARKKMEKLLRGVIQEEGRAR